MSRYNKQACHTPADLLKHRCKRETVKVLMAISLMSGLIKMLIANSSMQKSLRSFSS